MNVDRATLADVRAVAQTHVDAWRAACRDILPAGYLASLSAAQRELMWRESVESGRPELLVAREDGAVRGRAAFGACRDRGAPATQAELRALYVAPGSWSKGVGRTLWRSASKTMRAQGCTGCSLWVFVRDEQAIRFYRALGFAAEPVPPPTFELGGRELLEARDLCRFDAPADAQAD
jgi:GNAT superfamily N-acetyltransferase